MGMMFEVGSNSIESVQNDCGCIVDICMTRMLFAKTWLTCQRYREKDRRMSKQIKEVRTRLNVIEVY
jgi:hypothetical protein